MGQCGQAVAGLEAGLGIIVHLVLYVINRKFRHV